MARKRIEAGSWCGEEVPGQRPGVEAAAERPLQELGRGKYDRIGKHLRRAPVSVLTHCPIFPAWYAFEADPMQDVEHLLKKRQTFSAAQIPANEYLPALRVGVECGAGIGIRQVAMAYQGNPKRFQQYI